MILTKRDWRLGMDRPEGMREMRGRGSIKPPAWSRSSPAIYVAQKILLKVK